MEEIRKYPVGMQTFAEIREKNYVYVDKTKYIVEFLKQGSKYVFLSRPRRFGKSLFVSTLHAYYEGRKDLFEGLALGDYEKNWIKHPVLHFDMSTAKHMDVKGLLSELNLKLVQYERIYGRDKEAENPNQRLECLVKRAYEQTGQKVVLLIDEYDAPLLDVVHEKDNLKPLRQTMRNFYSPIKYLDPWLEFTFITGITKFSEFDLDNLDDISMHEQYSGICGISKTELLTDMKPDVEILAKVLDKTFDEMVEVLKRIYGGFHFCEKLEDIFCSASLLKAFESQRISIQSIISDNSYCLIEGIPIDEKRFAVEDFCVSFEQVSSAIPMLYQTGYLTIKGINPLLHCFHLGLPNEDMLDFMQQIDDKGYLIPYSADGKRLVKVGINYDSDKRTIGEWKIVEE